MPCINLFTNQSLNQDEELQLAKNLSALAAEMLGKPEHYVMVIINTNKTMLMSGNETATAYIELKSLGLNEQQTTSYSAALCELMQTELNIESGRVYIEFSNGQRHLWGYNSATF